MYQHYILEPNTQKTKKKKKTPKKEKKMLVVLMYSNHRLKGEWFLAQSKQRPPLCLTLSSLFTDSLQLIPVSGEGGKGPAPLFYRLELLWTCRNRPASTGWPARAISSEKKFQTLLIFEQFLCSLLLRPVCFLLIPNSRATCFFSL